MYTWLFTNVNFSVGVLNVLIMCRSAMVTLVLVQGWIYGGWTLSWRCTLRQYLDIFLRCKMRGLSKTYFFLLLLRLVQCWIWTTWDVYNILCQQNTLHFLQNHPALSVYFCYKSSMCNHLVVSLWTPNNCKFVKSIELSCKYHFK